LELHIIEFLEIKLNIGFDMYELWIRLVFHRFIFENASSHRPLYIAKTGPLFQSFRQQYDVSLIMIVPIIISIYKYLEWIVF
jgi:hypothetical protein